MEVNHHPGTQHHPGIPTPMGGPLLAHLTCPSQLTWSTMQQLLPITNDGVLHPGSISAAAAFPGGLRQGLTIQELDADGRVLHPGTISAAAAHPAGPRRRLTAQQLDADGSCFTLAPSVQQQPRADSPAISERHQRVSVASKTRPKNPVMKRYRSSNFYQTLNHAKAPVWDPKVKKGSLKHPQ